MPKVVYNANQGLVQQTGAGVSFETTPITPVQAQTANVSLTAPGAYTFSGSTAVPLTGTMPLAADVPGGIFVFRYASADTHVLTGSAEAAGTKVFKATNAAFAGSKIALAGDIGSSATLVSDGKSFIVFANTGSLTFSGT